LREKKKSQQKPGFLLATACSLDHPRANAITDCREVFRYPLAALMLPVGAQIFFAVLTIKST
jgi:hypothetical protein